MLIPPDQMSSPSVVSGVRVTLSLVLLIVVCPFAIMLSVLLCFTYYDYTFGIFQLLLTILILNFMFQLLIIMLKLEIIQVMF